MKNRKLESCRVLERVNSHSIRKLKATNELGIKPEEKKFENHTRCKNPGNSRKSTLCSESNDENDLDFVLGSKILKPDTST